MKYGNCVIGAFALLWRERWNKPRFLLKSRPGTIIPHLMLKSETGLHHYRVEKDLLPWPFCYLVFKGRFQTVQPGEESDYDKSSFFRYRS